MERTSTRREDLNPLAFAAAFLGLAVVLQLAASTAFAQRFLGEPLCSLVARISALLLSPFGRASVDGTRLGFDDFSVVIDCAAERNGAFGIYVGQRSTVRGSTSYNNGDVGIQATVAALVVNNQSANNSIGIEMVQSAGPGSHWADQQILNRGPQIRAAVRLVRWLQARYDIPTNEVIGHSMANDDRYF